MRTRGAGGSPAAGPPADLRQTIGAAMSLDQAEEALWREYRTRLIRFVRNRVGDEAAAEDIVHDVLVRAYTRRDTLRDGLKFEPWLYQITRNAVIDHYRSRRPSEPLPEDLRARDDAAPADALRELSACMEPLVGSLPPHYRDAVVLSELKGLTQQDTATQLGLSLSGAKSRVQRGRRMLEDKLLRCCQLEFDSRGSIVGYEKRNGCAPDSGGDCAGC